MNDDHFALVTGASSGLGAAYAREISRRTSLSLILVARRAERLSALKAEIDGAWTRSGRRCLVMPGDLTDADFRKAVASRIAAEGLKMQMLVNNAGFGTVGPFAGLQPERQANMVELNCEAVVHLTGLLLPNLLSPREAENRAPAASIINVCSTAAKQPMPYMATYAATKSFLLSFSLALYQELKPKGVHVLAHCPGPTESEFHLVAGLQEKLNFLPVLSAERVVREALAAAESRRPIFVNGGLNRAVALLAACLPATTSAAIVRMILSKVDR